MNRLTQILTDMDVPRLRLNTEETANVKWLLRNLHINNSTHPNLDEALLLLKKLS